MSLPEKAADTTAEDPWPVRLLSAKIADYVERMSVTWVEGQVVQLNRRPGARTAYLTLRDADVDMSLSCSVRVTALDAMPAPLTQGARVVVQAKPSYWTQRGSLSMDVRQIRPVGVGELLARVEYLRQHLRSEGLFDDSRKRPLPFLPRRVGLICGRASAAERDVVENARRRWPSLPIEIRQVAVQGVEAVTAVSAALAELDALDDVDVIVISRGGGSVEDLLPFSNEALVRAVAQARTPVVSAIGHESDQPLLDLVADVRASTPTHAATLVSPDAAAERDGLDQALDRMRRSTRVRLDRERCQLEGLTSRPVLTDRAGVVRVQREHVTTLRDRVRRQADVRLTRERDRVDHLRAQARVLSPASTLERGYAVIQRRDGAVVDSREDLEVEELLRVTVADGDFAVRVAGS
ncbi:exodeoxyribonuclease VII large subunit [Janibacter alkaliphilus]|uniref:Exodeoxyribonuclease 7 large subunit n=1 Tax=Janibacter alkaliphilus TaxID=1069963 RepID=A0A852X2F4_9MICO|nr:exodeoxyribonuclease VII large subunit [Janibacter alkaliphilus]NYG37246.1 exodeoxyribonuclease VII large subunit [Janibacter alkaliphilus]